MTTQLIAAIDVHAHYGTYVRQGNAPLRDRFMTADGPEVARRAQRMNIQYTIVSPLLGLLPRGAADAEAGDEEANRVVEQTDGLLQWVIVDPHRPGTYRQAEQRLKHPKCVGIKIHGEEHGYPIGLHGEALFSFAARHQAVVLAHSGNANTMPLDFVPFADRYPQVTLILAHLGNCGEPDADPSHQVRAIQASKHGNIYTDTSSAQSILPNLIEWAVREVGPEKILFGTDTPLYHVANQRARIDAADLSDQAKRMILRDNAVRLLKLPPGSNPTRK